MRPSALSTGTCSTGIHCRARPAPARTAPCPTGAARAAVCARGLWRRVAGVRSLHCPRVSRRARAPQVAPARLRDRVVSGRVGRGCGRGRVAAAAKEGRARAPQPLGGPALASAVPSCHARMPAAAEEESLFETARLLRSPHAAVRRAALGAVSAQAASAAAARGGDDVLREVADAAGTCARSTLATRLRARQCWRERTCPALTALHSAAEAVAEACARVAPKSSAVSALRVAEALAFGSGTTGRMTAEALARSAFCARAALAAMDPNLSLWNVRDGERVWRVARRCAATLAHTRAKDTRCLDEELFRVVEVAVRSLAAATCASLGTPARPPPSLAAAACAADVITLMTHHQRHDGLALGHARAATDALARGALAAGLVVAVGDWSLPLAGEPVDVLDGKPSDSLLSLIGGWTEPGKRFTMAAEQALLASALCGLPSTCEAMIGRGVPEALLRAMPETASAVEGGALNEATVEARCRLLAVLIEAGAAFISNDELAWLAVCAEPALSALCAERRAPNSRKWASAARAAAARLTGRLHVGLPCALGARLRILLRGAPLQGAYADVQLPHSRRAHGIVLSARCPPLLAAAEGKDEKVLDATRAAGAAALDAALEHIYCGEATLDDAPEQAANLLALSKALGLHKLASALRVRLPLAVGIEALWSPVVLAPKECVDESAQNAGAARERGCTESQPSAEDRASYCDFVVQCCDEMMEGRCNDGDASSTSSVADSEGPAHTRACVRMSLAVLAAHSPLFSPRIRDAFAAERWTRSPAEQGVSTSGAHALWMWMCTRTLPRGATSLPALANAATLADLWMIGPSPVGIGNNGGASKEDDAASAIERALLEALDDGCSGAHVRPASECDVKAEAAAAAARVASGMYPLLAFSAARDKALCYLAKKWSELDADLREDLLDEQLRNDVLRLRMELLSVS